MRKVLISLLLLFILVAGAQQTPQQKLDALFSGKSRGVLVVAHRGDWRQTPENSIQSLVNCIDKGIDICEFDLKKTKDDQIIIMHDKTIDRTTNGKGKPEYHTLSEIKKFRLLSGTGHPTVHVIPTLEEMLVAAKDRIIINVDKGYDYFAEVVPMLTKHEMLGQTIYNINSLPYDSLVSKHGKIPDDLTLQVIINSKISDVEKIINTYKAHKRTIVQIIFDSDTAEIVRKIPAIGKQFPIWFNSLWPEHNGGHDDDKAVEEGKPDETWGWLVARGAAIIQSDRPIELLNYLKARKHR